MVRVAAFFAFQSELQDDLIYFDDDSHFHIGILNK